MKITTDTERILLDHLETSASHLGNLLTLLDVFTESDPFAYESEYLNPDARLAHHTQTLRFLSGLTDLTQCYRQEMERIIASCYAGNQKDCAPLA